MFFTPHSTIPFSLPADVMVSFSTLPLLSSSFSLHSFTPSHSICLYQPCSLLPPSPHPHFSSSLLSLPLSLPPSFISLPPSFLSLPFFISLPPSFLSLPPSFLSLTSFLSLPPSFLSLHPTSHLPSHLLPFPTPLLSSSIPLLSFTPSSAVWVAVSLCSLLRYPHCKFPFAISGNQL